ncbi:TPA: phosphoribosylglycinamide formyltransferase [Candidatus Poribacteria bacterium]|nr:phosphoribosylglycinamide formyltransferase [Candidatus Poribacteria bacterium]
MKIGVLASGSGTNLQAIIDKLHKNEKVDVQIAVVISDNEHAYALERARKAGIPAVFIDMSRYPTREEFDEAIDRVLRRYGVELVVLAGYMKILQPPFVRKWRNRIMNIHPALLPSFPGTHAVRDALRYGVKITGVTIHFVDEGVDTGPIIAQIPVPVYDDDTEETLHNRIHVEEHKLYPEVIRLYAEGRISVRGRKVRVRR